MDNFKIIYQILSYLEENMDKEKPDMSGLSQEKLGVTEARFYNILRILVDAGYISGITFTPLLSGDYCINSFRPSITLAGLEYLANNTTMKKFVNTLKEIKAATPGL